MAVGVLLSMWISNSGVTAMLIPIVDAVIDELFHDFDMKRVDNSVGIPLVSMNEKEQPVER